MLKPKSVTHQAEHWQIVSFAAQSDMLVSSYRIEDPATWERIEQFEVVVNMQYQLVRLSRQALDLLNIARQAPAQTIPITTTWKDREIGIIPVSMATALVTRLQSKEKHTGEVVKLETIGYEPPTDWKKMNVDFNWFIQAHEFRRPASERVYHLEHGGILLRLIIESVDYPIMSIGNNIDIDVKPVEIAPGFWCFDLRDGFRYPDGFPRPTLDLYQIANPNVRTPLRLGNDPTLIIIEKAWPIQPVSR